jgi:hypothetical protein
VSSPIATTESENDPGATPRNTPQPRGFCARACGTLLRARAPSFQVSGGSAARRGGPAQFPAGGASRQFQAGPDADRAPLPRFQAAIRCADRRPALRRGASREAAGRGLRARIGV